MAHPSRRLANPLRAAVAAALTLGIAAVGVPAASAAPGHIAVPLDPTYSRMWIVPEPTTNLGRWDAWVAYGGTLTVELPSQVVVNPTSSFDLDFRLDYSLNGSPFMATGPRHDRFSTTDPTAGPLAVTDLGGNRFQITMPASADVDNVPGQPHLSQLTISDLSSPAERTTENGGGIEDYHAYVDLNPVNAPAVTLTNRLGVVANQNGVTVPAGTTLDLTLPSTSALVQAGLTSLQGTEISFNRANAGLREDFGPDLPITTTVAADGLSASVVLPAQLPTTDTYALTVRSLGPDLDLSMGILVDIPDVNPGLRSETGGDDVVTGAADWAPWAGGAGALALIGGAALALRRRETA